jgi:hypothetical protein
LQRTRDQRQKTTLQRTPCTAARTEGAALRARNMQHAACNRKPLTTLQRARGGRRQTPTCTGQHETGTARYRRRAVARRRGALHDALVARVREDRARRKRSTPIVPLHSMPSASRTCPCQHAHTFFD